MDRLISERYLNWLCFKWSTVCYLNSNDHGDSYIALAGEDVECYTGSDVDMLRSWLDRHDKEWAFGYLGYDLKISWRNWKVIMRIGWECLMRSSLFLKS